MSEQNPAPKKRAPRKKAVPQAPVADADAALVQDAPTAPRKAAKAAKAAKGDESAGRYEKSGVQRAA